MPTILVVLAAFIGAVGGPAVAQQPPGVGRTADVEPINSPTPVVDSLPGLPIASTDPRTGTSSAVAVQRIMLGGALDTSWRPDSTGALAARVAISRQLNIHDGHGGFYLAWVDESPGDPNIRVQRFGPDSWISEGWPLDGFPACAAVGSQYQPDLASDGADGALVAWTDFRASPAALFVQRMTASGALAEGRARPCRCVSA